MLNFAEIQSSLSSNNIHIILKVHIARVTSYIFIDGD
jgi:hypothetical protein